MIETIPQQFSDVKEVPEAGATPRTVDWTNPRVAAILDAAAKCFARNGFSGTTLAEIGKELGLRKSIVHYYFASKAALIHEVQSYTYHKYLEQIRGAVGENPDPSIDKGAEAMRLLWNAARGGNVGLNIEVWSASRNDEELRRRAAALQAEKRKLVASGLKEILGPAATPSDLEPLCTLVLGVLNGLAVSDHIEGDSARASEAYEVFLRLVQSSAARLQAQSA